MPFSISPLSLAPAAPEYATANQIAALRKYYEGQLADPNAFNKSGKMPFYGWANGLNDMMSQALAARGLGQVGRQEVASGREDSSQLNIPGLFGQIPGPTYGR